MDRRVVRLVIVAVLIVLYLYARKHSVLGVNLGDLERAGEAEFVRWVGIIAEVFIGLMFFGMMWVAYYPFKGQSVYDRKLGVVLCWIVGGVFLLIGAAIALGMVYQIRSLVLVPGISTIVVGVIASGGLIVEARKGLKKKREQREQRAQWIKAQPTPASPAETKQDT